MRIIRHTDRNFASQIRQLNRQPKASPEVRQTVEEIFQAVEKSGDKAVLHYVKKFGGPEMKAAQMRVSDVELSLAVKSLDARTRKAIQTAVKNVEKFAQKSLRQTWFMKNQEGAIVGERFDPFPRVGIYIPGGTAPLVSTAIMTCTLARAAGVPEIVAVTPTGPDGSAHPALLAALAICGATEVYRIGGAQAIAALTLGTKTIQPVVKLFGPGNAYVVEAKRQAFGRVAVDLLPGPSEVLVIADASAHPEWIAADLLAQSEHGHGSASLFLTDSARLIQQVLKAVDRQVAASQRKTHLKTALKNARVVLVKNMSEAIALANDYAAEHVAIHTKQPGEVAGQLTTSGAIFMGGFSPVAAGDFLAGPSHELPTGGAGKSFAGLTADQFQRRTSIVRYDKTSLQAALPTIQTFSELEGLDAHGRSASIRLA